MSFCATVRACSMHDHSSSSWRPSSPLRWRSRPPGAGSQYAFAVTDAKGQPFDGGKTYKLRLPHNIPAKNFWSLVLYGAQTRSMLQTAQQFPSIGSEKKGVVINPDTSVDVYFGPKAPPGKEGNWVQTWPGKGWSVILRLYGPEQAFFDKTWKPGEFEEVTSGQ